MEPKPMPPEFERKTEIRLFQDKDAGDISAIIVRCLKEVNSKDYPPETINGMVAYWTPAKVKERSLEKEMFVAERDGKLVGTVSRDGNKVYTTFVNPDVGGQGIGGQLMDHVENLAAAENYDYMETGASITAHNFYRKRGYKDVRETMTEDAGLNYILQKPLTPAES